jgi:glycosyltransferase involved in cell wall biosynthesis
MPILPRPKVCYLRGSFLNPFETQYLEPLQQDFDIVAAYSSSHRFDVSQISLPRVELPCLDYLNGIIPRRIAGRSVPNILKSLGYNEVLLGLDRSLAGYDLVHAQEQGFFFTWQAGKRKRRLGYKLISVQAEVNPYWYLGRRGLSRRAALVRRETDLFIARSQRAKHALICEGVDPDRVHVIGHGVNLARFRPGPRDVELCTSLGIDCDRFIILFVGHLLWSKGIFALADAAKLLLQHPAIKALDPLFLIVGAGDERARLESRLRRLGIERSFALVGRQPYDRLPALHRLADVFVLPSISTPYISEQFGIVLIESMATGKPVVSTHCGAMDEVVGDAGILVQPNDYYRLYHALRKLCLDESCRVEIGERGLARAKQRFSHEAIADAIAEAYWEALRR